LFVLTVYPSGPHYRRHNRSFALQITNQHIFADSAIETIQNCVQLISCTAPGLANSLHGTTAFPSVILKHNMFISIIYDDGGDDSNNNDDDCDDANNSNNLVYSCLQSQTTDGSRVRLSDHLHTRSECSLLQITV
jgi:hypothetical protein